MPRKWLRVISSWLLVKNIHTQKGAVAPIIVVLILLSGLGVGLFLINKPTNLTPKASGGSVTFVDDSGKQITETGSTKVKLRVTSPWVTDEGYSGDDCGGGNSFYLVKPVIADSEDEDSSEQNTKKPKQSKAPKQKCVVVKEVIVSESPNFSDSSTKTFPYTGKSKTMMVDYEFSKSLSGTVDPGKKSVYVKFRATDNVTEQNALPFPATIEYKSGGAIVADPSKKPDQGDKSSGSKNAPSMKLVRDKTGDEGNTGCWFYLKVGFDSAGVEIERVDASIKYDPSRLGGTFIYIRNFTDYPTAIGDKESGVMKITGLNSFVKYGKGDLGTIVFNVKPNARKGRTIISFDFDPNNKTKSTDSNIVEKGTLVDVLSSVSNYSYNIDNNSNCPAN